MLSCLSVVLLVIGLILPASAANAGLLETICNEASGQYNVGIFGSQTNYICDFPVGTLPLLPDTDWENACFAEYNPEHSPGGYTPEQFENSWDCQIVCPECLEN